MTAALDKAGGPFEFDDTPREAPQSGGALRSNTFFNEFDSVLAEALPQLVWVADAAGSTIYVNQRWYDYTGLTPEEALGPHGWTRALHPDDREQAASAFAAALAQHAPYEAAYRIVAADGSVRWFLSRGLPLVCADQTIRWFGTCTDIDAQKRAEAAFSDSATAFRALAEELPELVWSSTGEQEITYLNRQWEEYTGFPVESLALRNGIWSLVHPDDLHRAKQDWVEATRTHSPYQTEMRLLRKDRQYRWFVVRAKPLQSDSGEILMWFGTCADIEAEKRTLATLSYRETAFRQIAETMPQIVFRSRPDGSTEYMNARWLEYTGIDLETCKGDGWKAALHPDDHESSARTLARSVAMGTGGELEYRLRGHDGRYRWFLARAEPLRNEDGTIRAWIGTCTDIDEKKRAETALKIIADASVALSRSLDPESTLEALLHIVVPAFGDCAWVNVPDADGDLHAVAILHRDPSLDPIIEQLRGQPLVTSAPYGSRAVFENGLPLVISDLSVESLGQLLRPEYVELVARLGLQTIVIAPIMSDQRQILGTVSIGSVTGRPYLAEVDVPALREIGIRAALAIENARLYDREHRLATVLQEAQLPHKLPTLPNIALDATYVSAKDEARVGGDWYDAFLTQAGRLVLTIGDVCGKGIEAVATMAAMRQGLKAFAQVVDDPCTMLDLADKLLRAESGEKLATAFAAVLDPATGELCYASAGHPPPLLRDASGQVTQLFRPGLPLGLRRGRPKAALRIVLEPQSFLVLYTDGLIEDGKNIIEGERRLAAAAGDPSFTRAANPAAYLLEHLLHRGARDDVAVLTLRYDNHIVSI